MKTLKGLRPYAITFFASVSIVASPLAETVKDRQIAIDVILSGTAPIYETLFTTLAHNLSPRYVLTKSLAEDWKADNTDSILVSVGARALEILIANDHDRACLSVLVPANKFLGDVKHNPIAQSMLQRGELSAIYMDQPPARQLNFARLVNPQLKSIGTIYDQYSTELANQLAESAAQLTIEFHKQSLSEQDNPVATLRKMYADIDVFLALPGKYIFNPSTAKWMLYLSYQNRKPLLGFSADYVQAGAFAAVFSNPADIALQASEWIKAAAENDYKFNAPGYPTHFNVSINKQVAARINLESLSEEQLHRQLLQMEMSQ